MSEENRIEEEVKEFNPIDEYLNNYKEQKLAEFCVQKDKEIASRKEERQKLIDQISDLKTKADKYEKTWENVAALYSEIKKLPVDEYLRLYHLFYNDILEHKQSYSNIAYTISPYVGSTTISSKC